MYFIHTGYFLDIVNYLSRLDMFRDCFKKNIDRLADYPRRPPQYYDSNNNSNDGVSDIPSGECNDYTRNDDAN